MHGAWEAASMLEWLYMKYCTLYPWVHFSLGTLYRTNDQAGSGQKVVPP